MKEVPLKPGEYMSKRKKPNGFKVIALIVSGVLIVVLLISCLWLVPDIIGLTNQKQKVAGNTQATPAPNTNIEAAPEKTNISELTDNSVQVDNAANIETDSDNEKISSQTSPLFDYNLPDCQVIYVKHELSTDYEGNRCLILYYTYTNKSDEAKSAMGNACYIQAYQNGIECDRATISYDVKNQAVDNHLKNVMPGISLDVAEVFQISDESDVTLILSNIFDILGDSPTVTATLSLAQ